MTTATTNPTNFISKNAVRWLGLSHFANDFFSGLLGILLAAQDDVLHLSNSQIGLATGLFYLVSISQPVFGWLSDHIKNQALMLSGAMWTAVGLLICGLADNFTLVAVGAFLGGIGNAMFHPGALAGARLLSAEKSKGRSFGLFMFGGNGGFAISPFLAGFVLEAYGPKGVAPFVLVNLALVPFIIWRLNPDLKSATAKDTEAKLAKIKEDTLAASLAPVPPASLRWYQTTATLIVVFAIIVLLRNTLQQSLNSFLPIYYKDQGYGLEFAGAATTAYLFAAAFGSYIGATLSDRFSRVLIMSVSMLLITPLNLLLFQTSSTILIVIISVGLGLIFNANWPILLMVGQEIFPGKAGSASGLVFGWAFVANALGGYFTGQLADNIGLTEALRLVALLPILAAFMILALPSEQRDTPLILQPSPQAGD